MRVGMMTKEYPPEIYGGAGVHVTELTRFMRGIDGVDVDVHCMGAPRDQANVYVHGVDPALEDANGALKTLSTGLRMAHSANNLDVVHSHTWYAGLGGHLTGLMYDIPHVATAHSLEPDRPWKREQLGGGYNAMENADAVIAVSSGMKDNILRAYPSIDPDKVHVVLNGIDTELWYPTKGTITEELGVDPTRPIVSFVGRITRQKGVPHLLKAAQLFDTLVDYDESDPETFERNLAEAVNAVVADADTAARMGQAGRERAVADFSWATIAQQTVDIYKKLI